MEKTWRRGKVREFSAKSKKNLLLMARNFPKLKTMITLTYPKNFPMDGSLVKKHWYAFRHFLTRRGASGIWLIEFQKRGAPHFHILINKRIHRDDIALAWYGIVDSGDIQHLLAGTRVEKLRKPEAAGAYAAKYATKNYQKVVPEGYEDVGRFWGRFGPVVVTPKVVIEGSQTIINPVVRALRGYHRSIQHGKKLSDDGTASMTLWNSSISAKMVIKIVDNLLKNKDLLWKKEDFVLIKTVNYNALLRPAYGHSFSFFLERP